MQFESSIKRNFLINAFLGLIPDFVIAVIATYFFEPDARVWTFIVTILGLQCLYFLIWLKDTIWKWIFFIYRGKRLMIEHIENVLKASNYPVPDDIESSAEGYFNSIVENEELDTSLRIKAAAEIGAMNYPKAYQRIQESVMLNIAYEEALKNYSNYLNILKVASKHGRHEWQ